MSIPPGRDEPIGLRVIRRAPSDHPSGVRSRHTPRHDDLRARPAGRRSASRLTGPGPGYSGKTAKPRVGEVNPSLRKHPSAFLPVAMSLGALATAALFIALHGTSPQADEGAAAHIWQLLMAGQVPIVLFFAIKWLPQSPRQGVPILALQIGAALAAMAPVFLLHW